MGKINLSRVRSVCCLSWFSLLFVLLAVAGILYLFFTKYDGSNIDYLRVSNWLLGSLIVDSKDAGAILQIFSTQTTVFVNFCIMIAVYVIIYFGFILFPTIGAVIASKVSVIKGYGRTAIFTTPAVFVWLVLAPLVWLVSTIVLMSVSISYINKENEMLEKYSNGNYPLYKENQSQYRR